jgi:hypothetical protein
MHRHVVECDGTPLLIDYKRFAGDRNIWHIIKETAVGSLQESRWQVKGRLVLALSMITFDLRTEGWGSVG